MSVNSAVLQVALPRSLAGSVVPIVINLRWENERCLNIIFFNYQRKMIIKGQFDYQRTMAASVTSLLRSRYSGFYFFYMFSSSNIHLKNAHFQLDTWIAASCMWLEI